MSGLGLLRGVRVVSLEQYISGPYCTSILADAGAEVIKVERPGAGDPRRTYDPRLGPEDDYVSGGFASYNRGKRSLELDLRQEDDVTTLRHLLAEADVFVCNNRPGSLERLGLGVPALCEQFPHLVICEISGFGTTGGPYADRPAFDSVIQAMSGMSSLIGASADSPPDLAPMGTMDLLSGIYATLGILAALVQRNRTGQGTHVDAAMYDIGAAFLERPLTLHEFTGEVPTRGIDRFSPVGAFRAGDGGWISIVIPTDDMWRRCCAAMGRPELETDPQLDTVLKRAERMKDLVVPALESWAAGMTRDETVAKLQAAGQPAGAVQTIDEVRHCPQLAHRGLFIPMADERLRREDGSHPALPHLPLLFDGQSAEPGLVPRLGSGNELRSTTGSDVTP
ncbi:CoA transferase [Saccharopolyspora terrae]|uniref:CoA transferase n=1 Tax=Saccharopolyspora terrae TaxID=2530384 RepID=A0A4R4VDH0_9PSEU|nr:CoA transferase [Saccharopolyspora terrae]TDD03332.1 CoA transferase [Saccharopolyspora terrae]